MLFDAGWMPCVASAKFFVEQGIELRTHATAFSHIGSWHQSEVKDQLWAPAWAMHLLYAIAPCKLPVGFKSRMYQFFIAHPERLEEFLQVCRSANALGLGIPATSSLVRSYLAANGP